MDALLRDIALLAGCTADLYTMLLRSLRDQLDAQLVLNPTWGSSELIDWAILETGVPEASLSEDYITAISDMVDNALTL